MCDDKSSFGTFCAEDHHLALLGKQCRGRVFCPHTEGWLVTWLDSWHVTAASHLTRLGRSQPRHWAISSPASSHLTTPTLRSQNMRRWLQLLVADTMLQLLYSPANGCSLSALPSLLLLSTDHTFVENYNDDHQPLLLSVSVLLIGAATFHNI